MMLLNYIVLAFALGIQTLVSTSSSAAESQVRLTRGLINSLMVALVFCLLFVVGAALGNLLRFDWPQVDGNIFLGFSILVVVKLLFGMRRARTAYDISRPGTALALAVAQGVNVLLLGLGWGFKVLVSSDLWKMAIPMLLVVTLMTYWGTMLGRRQVDIRPRRWQWISLLALLASTLSLYLQ